MLVEVDLVDRDLPASRAYTDLDAQCATDDLVAEADSYDGDLCGGENLLDIVDQDENPSIIGEGSVL